MPDTTDFTKPIFDTEGWSMLPTVEFTEDEWVSVYKGYCIDKTNYSYLVNSNEYGTFWISKDYVRIANN